MESTEKAYPPLMKSMDKTKIFSLGIRNAKEHNINVIGDFPNLARGDCIFEALIYNINHRFTEKLLKPVQEYREDWCTELMLLYKETAYYPGDEHLDDWYAAWNQQMNPRQFNIDEYNVSDLVPPGLAHCISKDILVFNVQPNAISPVNVYQGSIFNDVSTSSIPVMIVYNGNHYESLLPVSQTDIDKSIQLVNSLKNDTYNKDNPTSYLVAKEPTQKFIQNKIKDNLYPIERNIIEDPPRIKKNLKQEKSNDYQQQENKKEMKETHKKLDTNPTYDLGEKTLHQLDELQQDMRKHHIANICNICKEKCINEQTLREHKQNKHITFPAEACQKQKAENSEHLAHACQECNKCTIRPTKNYSGVKANTIEEWKVKISKQISLN